VDGAPDADGRELAGAAALLLVRVLDVRNAADGLPVVDLRASHARMTRRRFRLRVSDEDRG